jgi:hypothetical protein
LTLALHFANWIVMPRYQVGSSVVLQKKKKKKVVSLLTYNAKDWH